jgi:hypothetical protein
MGSRKRSRSTASRSSIASSVVNPCTEADGAHGADIEHVAHRAARERLAAMLQSPPFARAVIAFPLCR